MVSARASETREPSPGLSLRSRQWWAVPILVWLFLVAASALWNHYASREHASDVARSTARAFFEEVQTSRQWNAEHGGVYVPVTERTQPNPYLEVSHRDVVTTGGKSLTLINPAFMTRQIAGIAADKDGVQFHITSLNPIRPANRPDPWEEAALTEFEAGVPECLELVERSDGKTFRYMKPLLVRSACLKCHAKQGYELDQIRGGISVSLPAEPYLRASRKREGAVWALHVGILVLGVAGIVLFLIRSRRQIVALDESREQAEAASRAKSVFLANMSHAFRTPLNSILGFSEWMRGDASLSQEHHERLTAIDRSGRELLSLVDDVLETTKATGAEATATRNAFDLYGLLDHTETTFRGRAEHKGLGFELHKLSDLSRYVAADKEKLSKVLSHLLDNAVKFTQGGSIVLRVSDERADRESDELEHRVRFEIEDTGVGIPEGDLERLFGHFEQAVIGSESEGGTGLGLAISSQLIRLMGGELTASSKVGRGSVFRFEIPVEQASDSDVDEEAPAEVEPVGERADVKTGATSVLAPDALAALPAELVDEMREATNRADLDLLNELINQVAQRDEPLATALRDLASAFEYDALCELFATQEADS